MKCSTQSLPLRERMPKSLRNHGLKDHRILLQVHHIQRACTPQRKRRLFSFSHHHKLFHKRTAKVFQQLARSFASKVQAKNAPSPHLRFLYPGKHHVEKGIRKTITPGNQRTFSRSANSRVSKTVNWEILAIRSDATNCKRTRKINRQKSLPKQTKPLR